MQKEFIEQLKSKSQGNTSFVEELADILDIGYDAAYRRINLRTNLSLEESVKLAKHYNVSLNKLFEVGSERTILAEISPELHNEANLEEYFIASRNNVYPLTKLKNELEACKKEKQQADSDRDAAKAINLVGVWLVFFLDLLGHGNKDISGGFLPFDDVAPHFLPLLKPSRILTA